MSAESMGAAAFSRTIVQGGNMPSIHQDKLNGFMRAMGFSQRLEVIDDAQNIMIADINYAGINLRIWHAAQEQVFSILVHFAFLPPQNVAPVMRRLLEIDYKLISGYYFGLGEDNSLYYMTVAPTETIELDEFKDLCNRAVSGYWELCTDLVKDFELPQEP
jgi:hypothetical protein